VDELLLLRTSRTRPRFLPLPLANYAEPTRLPTIKAPKHRRFSLYTVADELRQLLVAAGALGGPWALGLLSQPMPASTLACTCSAPAAS
jgi:hypothetical protein